MYSLSIRVLGLICAVLRELSENTKSAHNLFYISLFVNFIRISHLVKVIDLLVVTALESGHIRFLSFNFSRQKTSGGAGYCYCHGSGSKCKE